MLGKTKEAPARETGGFQRVVAPLLPTHNRIWSDHVEPVNLSPFSSKINSPWNKWKRKYIYYSVSLYLYICVYVFVCVCLSAITMIFDDGDDIWFLYGLLSEHHGSNTGWNSARILAGQPGWYVKRRKCFLVFFLFPCNRCCSHGGVLPLCLTLNYRSEPHCIRLKFQIL